MTEPVQIHKTWVKLGAEYALQQSSQLSPTLKEQKDFKEFLKKLTSAKIHLAYAYLKAGEATNTLPDPSTITSLTSEQNFLKSLDEKKIWLLLKVNEGMFQKHMEELGRGY